MSINKTVQFKVELTPEEMAFLFWSASSENQAAFFNELGRISRSLLPFQLLSVTDEESLNNDGRDAMRMIGEYSEKSTGQQS